MTWIFLMALISRQDAKRKLDLRFNYWWRSGTWGVATNCGYDDAGLNTDWVAAEDMKELRKNWESKSKGGYYYRTTPSSSSFTIDFLCHCKKPSDGTSFNFHLKTKA
jgi:hypothetical protein